MSDSSIQLFRFTCPQCHKILKARLEWAGKRGICPNCQTPLKFPKSTAPDKRSRTAEQLRELIGPDDNVTFDEKDIDRLSMLLSQSTCRDYALGQKLLANRPLSTKQWRTLLSSAAVRENMRLHIEDQLAQLAEIPDDDEPISTDSGEITDPNAWTILIRFLYFLRHAACEHCTGDPTGLTCIYRTFDTFLLARKVSPDRSHNWQRICHHHLGL